MCCEQVNLEAKEQGCFFFLQGFYRPLKASQHQIGDSDAIYFLNNRANSRSGSLAPNRAWLNWTRDKPLNITLALTRPSVSAVDDAAVALAFYI